MTARQRYRKRKNIFERCMDFLMSYKLVSICAAGVVIAGCAVGAVFMFASPALPVAADPVETPPIVEEQSDIPVPEGAQDYQEMIDAGIIDEDMLAGLTGDYSSEDVGQGDVVEDINAVGLMMGENSEDIAEGFGEAAQEYFLSGAIDEFMVYAYSEDINQRIQDVRSMINKGCRVIVLANAEEYFFSIATEIANTADVLVVAINAPANTGYSMNITSGGGDSLQGVYDFIAASPEGGDMYTVTSSAGFSETADETFTFAEYKGTIMADSEEYEQSMSTAFSAPLRAVISDSTSVLDTLNYAIEAQNLPTVYATTATAGVIKKWHELMTTGVNIAEDENEDDENENDDTDTTTQTAAELVMVEDSLLYATAQVSDAEMGAVAADIAARIIGGEMLATQEFEISGQLAVTNAEVAQYYEQYKDESNTTRISVPIDPAALDALFTEG